MKRKRPSGESLKKPFKVPRKLSQPTVTFSRPVMGATRIPARLTSRGAEVKSLDLTVSTSIDTTGSVQGLNFIRAGSSFFNRIGRRVELKSLMVKLQINPIRTMGTNDYMRIVIVYDRQTNGAAPAVADIIQDTDQAGTNTTNIFTDINLNNRDRFQIFMDKRISLPSLTLTAGVITNIGLIDPVSPHFIFTKFIKLGGELTQYKADSAPAVIGDIATGGLFMLVLGNQAAGAEGYSVLGKTRLRFNDI